MNVYDLEARVDKYIEVSEVQKPFLDPEFSREQDKIHSLLMFDAIAQWRAAEYEVGAQNVGKTNSLPQIFRPMAHLMERYQFYLS